MLPSDKQSQQDKINLLTQKQFQFPFFNISLSWAKVPITCDSEMNDNTM